MHFSGSDRAIETTQELCDSSERREATTVLMKADRLLLCERRAFPRDFILLSAALGERAGLAHPAERIGEAQRREVAA